MEILSKVEIVKSFDWILFVLACLSLVLTFRDIHCAFSDSTCFEVEDFFILGNIVASIFLSISLFVYSFVPHGTGRYRYEVLIDDPACISEIAEQYEIVEKHGEIWTLEDKENAAEIH